MMDVFESSLRISGSFERTEMLWLCRATDWMKLLQLPNVSWWQFLVAAASLVVVIWAVLRLAARVNEDVDPAEADREMLQRLNDLRREGDLSEDEFRSIKSQIVGRLNASWNVTPKSAMSAKTADQLSPGRDPVETSENLSSSDSGANEKTKQASQSNQSEFLVRPTNVPDPPQDTNHLSEGLTPPESENSQGNTEAGSQNNTQ